LANIGYRHDMQILETGEELYDFEEYFQKKDQPPLWLSSTKLPLKNNEGEIIGLLGIGRNITIQKLAQQQLKQVNQELESHIKKLIKSNSELEQYAYVASHDLQEPLRAITTFLTLLDLKYKDVLDETGQKYLNFAVDGSMHMRQLILDLLDLSKIGRNEEVLEEVDINDIINGIKNDESLIIEGKNVSFSVQNMPILKAPKSNIYQVFSNLISNSLKYSKDGLPLEIKIAIKDLNNHWQFSVADNGIGIEPEYFEKIFIVFQRLHGREKYSGTGVGLAITKKIIENLGGKIWVDSSIGKGSTFYFTIKK